MSPALKMLHLLSRGSPQALGKSLHPSPSAPTKKGPGIDHVGAGVRVPSHCPGSHCLPVLTKRQWVTTASPMTPTGLGANDLMTWRNCLSEKNLFQVTKKLLLDVYYHFSELKLPLSDPLTLTLHAGDLIYHVTERNQDISQELSWLPSSELQSKHNNT